MSVEEYRKILNDQVSPKEKIVQRLQYLEGFMRNVIKSELQNYVKEQTQKRKQLNQAPERI